MAANLEHGSAPFVISNTEAAKNAKALGKPGNWLGKSSDGKEHWRAVVSSQLPIVVGPTVVCRKCYPVVIRNASVDGVCNLTTWTRSTYRNWKHCTEFSASNRSIFVSMHSCLSSKKSMHDLLLCLVAYRRDTYSVSDLVHLNGPTSQLDQGASSCM